MPKEGRRSRGEAEWGKWRTRGGRDEDERRDGVKYADGREEHERWRRRYECKQREPKSRRVRERQSKRI